MSWVLIWLHTVIYFLYAANGPTIFRQIETGGAQHMHILMLPPMLFLLTSGVLGIAWITSLSQEAFARKPDVA